MLTEDIERLVGNRDRIEGPESPCPARDGRLENLLRMRRHDDAAPGLAGPMSRSAEPLHEAGDAGRQVHEHDRVDAADVDAELERRRADDGRKSPLFQIRLDLPTAIARQGAVMGRHLVGENLLEGEAEPFADVAGVGEEERGPMPGQDRQHMLDDAADHTRESAASGSIASSKVVRSGHRDDPARPIVARRGSGRPP